MTIQREELLSKLKRCLPGVENGGSMFQGADCFIFRDNSILTYNNYFAVSVPFKSDLACAVPATPFYKTVSSFKAESLTLLQEDNKLKLTCGRAKAEFVVIEEHTYERFLKIMPVNPDWKDLPTDFNTIVKSGILRSLPTGLEGVFFQDNNMIATNQVIIVNIDLGMKMERIWLNNKAATEITKFPMLEKYCTNSSWVHFKAGDITFSCLKLIDDNYPDKALLDSFDTFIQADDAVNGTFPSELGDILKRAAIFAEEGSDGSHVVKCSIEGTTMTVSSARTIGSFNETVEITRNDKSDEKIEWSADIVQFETAFRNNPKASFFVAKEGNRGALVFKGDNWRQIVGLLGGK
jgi:DNA polymerase III sliding clamp (beta) subunit (PCNA family)